MRPLWMPSRRRSIPRTSAYETVDEIIREIQAAYKRRTRGSAQSGCRAIEPPCSPACSRAPKAGSRSASTSPRSLPSSVSTARARHHLRQVRDMYQNDGYSILLGACDTFRAAANEQIKSWPTNSRSTSYPASTEPTQLPSPSMPTMPPKAAGATLSSSTPQAASIPKII